MLARNELAPDATGIAVKGRKVLSHWNGGTCKPQSQNSQVVVRLHHGRRHVLDVIHVGNGLYRIRWPDIGLSPPANLTRCRAAALVWAEHQVVTDLRNLPVARRLKSLANF